MATGWQGSAYVERGVKAMRNLLPHHPGGGAKREAIGTNARGILPRELDSTTTFVHASSPFLAALLYRTLPIASRGCCSPYSLLRSEPIDEIGFLYRRDKAVGTDRLLAHTQDARLPRQYHSSSSSSIASQKRSPEQDDIRRLTIPRRAALQMLAAFRRPALLVAAPRPCNACCTS